MMSRVRGFTLVELMITIAVLAVLIGVATPSFIDMVRASKIKSASDRLYASMSLARSEAIKRNGEVSVCVTSTPALATACGTGDWKQGWIILDESTSPATVIGRTEAQDTNLLIPSTSPAAAKVTFNGSGTGATPATFSIKHSQSSASDFYQSFTVTATGRAFVSNGN